MPVVDDVAILPRETQSMLQRHPPRRPTIPIAASMPGIRHGA
jgi:hypothetical protein